MVIDRIAIWVHPFWEKNDLGDRKFEFWLDNINFFAEDGRFAFVLTGCQSDTFLCSEWGERWRPIVSKLPDLFEGRYIRSEENYIDGHNPQHVSRLTEGLGLRDVEFNEMLGLPYPKTRLFREARVGGLISGPEYCVAEQMRQIKPLCELQSVYSWGKKSK